MTPVHTFRVFIVALALVITQAVLQPAAADQLDELRAKGQIGERFDGYAEARDGASDAARALVEKVNAQRREPQNMNFQHAEAPALGGAPQGAPDGGPQGQPQAPAQPATTPFVRDGRKVGRNEPCPCGSGKKYKQCHGKLS